jgi:hypothetical protein
MTAEESSALGRASAAAPDQKLIQEMDVIHHSINPGCGTYIVGFARVGATAWRGVVKAEAMALRVLARQLGISDLIAKHGQLFKRHDVLTSWRSGGPPAG